jgi:hypothetical protein
MKVVWLASYPKSAYTLVRMLLHNYIFGETNDTNLVAARIPGIHAMLVRLYRSGHAPFMPDIAY